MPRSRRPSERLCSTHVPLFVFLCLLAVGKALALLIYGSGFYITRVQLSNTSTCDFQPTGSNDIRRNRIQPGSNISSGEAECWTDAMIDKVVLVIVDGARFDFAAASFDMEESRWTRNSPLSSIAEIVQKKPVTTELFRFVADPPTTTQQRLKSILTGGLPTFLEISKSFGAAKLVEDNIIAQAASAGRRISFSGDDTWLELFHRAHFAASVDAHPSFNVRDLDSVDQGVRRHLLSALEYPNDWDILIGHFLGVDHAGHTYGVESQAMEKKLQEIDADIKSVMSIMSSDTAFDNALLIVMGDHGITLHGDHGGGTSAETDSFLLIHNPRAASVQKLTQNSNDANSAQSHAVRGFKMMSQIDFAPTLSAVLDLPIPFGSLGTIQRRFLEVAVASESHQESFASCINHVIEQWYLRSLRGTALQVWRYLNTYALEAGNPFSVDDWSRLQDLHNISQSFTASDYDGQKWLEAFLISAAETSRERWIHFNIRKMAVGVVLLTCLLAFCAMTYLPFTSEGTTVNMLLTSISSRMVTINSLLESRAVCLEILFLLTVGSLISGYRVSNSFISAEADVAHFTAASFVIFFLILRNSFLCRAMSSYRRYDATLHSGIGAASITCNAGCQLLGATWLKQAYHSTGYVRLLPFAFVQGPMFFSAFAALPWICHRDMIQGSTNGQRACVVLASTSVGLLTFKHGTCFVALLRLMGFGTFGPSVLPEIFLPWISYIASMIGLFLPRNLGGTCSPRYDIQNDAHSTTWPLLSIFILLFGERGSLWGVLSITQSAAALHSSLLGSATVKGGYLREVSHALLWQVLALQLFFAGGHYCTFDSLHFTSAFVGMKNFHFVTMGILLAANTWSGDALVSVNLPAVAVACFNPRKIDEEHLTQALGNALSRFVLSYAFFRLVTIIVTACFVGAVRSHLMVWSVFAPKFAFDAAGQIIGDVGLIFGVLSCLVGIRW